MTTHRTITQSVARRLTLAVAMVALCAAVVCADPALAADEAVTDEPAGAQIAAPSAPAYEPRMEAAPAALNGVKIVEHLGEKLPLELTFKDPGGRIVRLGDFFDGQHPVILTLNYSDCPMLCSQQLEGLVDSLREIDWTLGQEYRVVTVSINPNEAATKTKLAQQSYLRLYQRTADASGWQFLIGRSEPIEQLAAAVGFGYSWVADRKEYAHAAVSMICTPDGRLSRYLYGVRYEPKTVRLSLVEASDGRIGTAMDQIILYCFHYDAEAGSYVAAAVTLMRLAGLATIAVVGSTLIVLRRIDRRRQAQPDPELPKTTQAIPAV